jgi:hypothetical protein
MPLTFESGKALEHSKQTTWLISYFLLGLDCNLPVWDAIFFSLLWRRAHASWDFAFTFWRITDHIRDSLDQSFCRPKHVTDDIWEVWNQGRVVMKSESTKDWKPLNLIVYSQTYQTKTKKSLFIALWKGMLAYQEEDDHPHLVIWPEISIVVDGVLAKIKARIEAPENH